jgi:hypothetical protein
MRNVLSAAALATALAIWAGPAAAEHLYSYGQPSYGQPSYGQQHYDVQPQSGYPPAPDARTVIPRGFDYGRDRRGPRTGLDRPYGGHGVPYRTPPQGWPDRAH